MKRALKWLLALNLLALTALVFIYPHLMVGPGKLIKAHSQLETDCFACHAPLRGVAAQRCIVCHQVAQIGRLTSTGKPIVKSRAKVGMALSFHQDLQQQECIACHNDHAGVKRFRTQGRFDHALLQSATRSECQSCHKAPPDSLHQQISGNCNQCHTQQRWTPATFKHEQHFVLDRDHNTRCVTCHLRNDYRQVTCYGCHEHTVENVRRKHIKEGIGAFDNCVECHRSADEHDIRGEVGKKSSNRKEHD